MSNYAILGEYLREKINCAAFSVFAAERQQEICEYADRYREYETGDLDARIGMKSVKIYIVSN